MILIRAALIKIFQSFAIGALSLGILTCFLLTYSYLSGDRQDRTEMIATLEHSVDFFKARPLSHTRSASFASEN
jgi:hypothetical protein